ncbi:PAS domain-containing sensor histidine kinase [Autumnicola musiva]|uniref:histidine kinase n=1 Tax=Autumnicola musiva TaxID=3075589 RepID=A0ABU3D759_9FLAO|nr:ATP-binding protein [Zunongwangia sp. F117]MDT0677365.1 ATP-binding protein [Zunongwangia sp. F117]
MENDSRTDHKSDTTENLKAEIKRLHSLLDHEKEVNNRYKDIVHSSPSLIAFLKGEELVIDIANKAILDNWGKGDAIIGKPLMKAIPELEGQGFYELLMKVYHTGEVVQAYEMPGTHLVNGVKKLDYFDFFYQPQRNLQGKIEGVGIIATNVSAQAELHNQLKESELKLRQLIDFMPHKITIADTSGNSYYFNRSWQEYTGLSMADLVKQDRSKYVHPKEKEYVKNCVKQALTTGEDLELEMRILDKNGNYKWHLTRGIALRDKVGKIINWVSSSTEIQKLKEDERKKENFLKLVSHELKTPVTSIKGYTQLLTSILAKNKEAKVKNIPMSAYLGRIENQVERQIRLISEILDLSRIEENELEFNKQEFVLNELIEETVQDIRHSNIESTSIIISNSLNCNVLADRGRIGQVLVNIITNAIKYSPDKKEIFINIEKEKENFVSIKVKDSGIGINENELAKIFQRFYRVGAQNEGTYAGFGIGLFLSNEIIKRHGGSINVESTFGEGSEFTISLPYIN